MVDAIRFAKRFSNHSTLMKGFHLQIKSRRKMKWSLALSQIGFRICVFNLKKLWKASVWRNGILFEVFSLEMSINHFGASEESAAWCLAFLSLCRKPSSLVEGFGLWCFEIIGIVLLFTLAKVQWYCGNCTYLVCYALFNYASELLVQPNGSVAGMGE